MATDVAAQEMRENQVKEVGRTGQRGGKSRRRSGKCPEGSGHYVTPAPGAPGLPGTAG